MTDRRVRLIRGGNRHDGEPFVPPSTAYRDTADGDGLEVPAPAQKTLGVRVRHNAGYLSPARYAVAILGMMSTRSAGRLPADDGLAQRGVLSASSRAAS